MSHITSASVARSSTVGSVIASLLFASLAFAQTGTPAGTVAGTVVQPRPVVSGECVATAVGVREDALIVAHTAQNTAIGAALTTRKEELQAAWKLTDNKARHTAREAAHKKFREARKTVNQTMKSAVTAAHTAFNAAAKVCGVKYREAAEPAMSVSL
jgi:hypothetical protein